MITSSYKKIFKKINNRLSNSIYGKSDSRFLKDISGLIHIGANTGQERSFYHKFNLNVIWVEPIEIVYSELQHNLREYDKQEAIQALITDVDGKEYEFKIANNNGASSSIYDFKDHKDIWPHVTYNNTVKLNSITLSTLINSGKIDINKYQALVLDTQGSELLVLKGCLMYLKHFKYIKTEVADFESYQGCCTLSQMQKFMFEQGYTIYSKTIFANSPKGGKYFDVVFKKRA